MTLRPPLTILPTSRLNSVMGIQTTREVNTRFSQRCKKQNHTTGLVLPKPEEVDETDLEVTEIVEGTMNTNVSEPGQR